MNIFLGEIPTLADERALQNARYMFISRSYLIYICKMVELDFTLRILLRSITELRGVVTVLANVTSYGLALLVLDVHGSFRVTTSPENRNRSLDYCLYVEVL